jgi:hypothetical protein
MPKTKISEFDVNPDNNTDINSINIAEGCAPSGINNAIRQLMSDLKDWQAGTSGDLLPVAAGGTNASTAAGARASLLPSFTGNGGKVVAVKSDASDVEYITAATGDVTTSGTQTLTNKTIAYADNTLTGVAGVTATQTLTNKTLTTPVITGLRETRVAIPASDIDLATGNYFTRTISGTTTLTVSNVPTTGTAVSLILDLTNGGSATVNFWSGVKWVGGTAPTLTSAGRDSLGFFTHDGGTTWTGLVLGKDIK